MDAGEHISTDHLKGFHGVFLGLILRSLHGFTLKLVLDLLLSGSEIAGDLCNAVVVDKTANASSAFWQILRGQIHFQILVEHTHGDLTGAVVILKVKACPSTVHGDIPGKSTVIDDAHGKVGALVAVLPAVENPLGGIPHGAADNGLVVIWLKILVFLAIVLFGLVVLIVGRVGLSGQHVATVLFVAQDGHDTTGSPVGVHGSVPASASGGNRHLGKNLCHLLRRATVDQRGVHPAHNTGFILIDGQHLFLATEAIRNLDLVIAEKARRQEAASTETPLQREQDRLAFHVAFLLRHHCQNEKNDAAGLGHGVQILLLEKDPDWRIVVLQGFDPADAVHQISSEATHCLRDNHVDFTVHTVLHELLKALPMVRVRAGKAVIDIAARVLPVGVLLDLFHVLLDLEVDGKGLIDIIRRDAAVCGHPENPFLLRRFSGGGNHPYVSSVL